MTTTLYPGACARCKTPMDVAHPRATAWCDACRAMPIAPRPELPRDYTPDELLALGEWVDEHRTGHMTVAFRAIRSLEMLAVIRWDRAEAIRRYEQQGCCGRIGRRGTCEYHNKIPGFRGSYNAEAHGRMCPLLDGIQHVERWTREFCQWLEECEACPSK